MSQFQQIESILPDDLIELIYSKVVYTQPVELLDEIKKISKLNYYKRLLIRVDLAQKFAYLYDIGVVYFSTLKSNKAYVKYNRNSVPKNFFDNLMTEIDNSKDPNKKTIDICIKYLLKIPFNHIKHIFKQNRLPI